MKRLVTLFSIVILAFPLFWSCSKKEQEIQVASVTLSEPVAEMIIGESITLKAIIYPSKATVQEVIWASSKQSVATVDQNGKVVAISEGTSIITATAGGKVGSCVVSISKGVVAVSSISLDKASATLKVGETVTLTASVKPDDATDKTVTWSTSDASVATVEDGVVTALKLGSATIIAKAGDKEVTCEIKVEATPVAAVTLDKTSATLKVGETVVLTATVKPDDATDKTVTWSTSDASVATVVDGVVTAVKSGTASITVRANDGSDMSATCVVEVKQNVAVIILDYYSLSLIKGETVTLVATISPANASDKTLTWTSLDGSVATVNGDGMVTAKSKGKTTIKATANDGSGVIAECNVTVSSPCPAGAVDLGMTTTDGYKLYWATCNICETGFVNSPEKYGDYYAWGELEPYYTSLDPLTWKDGVEMSYGYDWYAYKWGSFPGTDLTRYNTDSSFGSVDNKTDLSDYDYVDDVARQHLGDSWRIPTDAEWTALLNQCTWTWTTQNGVNGRLVTGPNGNSIFLPAAGMWQGTTFGGEGTGGSYWSSSINPESPISGYYVPFNNNWVRRTGAYRSRGFSIRPVSD